MDISVGAFIASLIGTLILGLVIGFCVTRVIFKNQLKKNPPINEKQIRAMYQAMGRKPSEAQIRQVMNSMKNNM